MCVTWLRLPMKKLIKWNQAWIGNCSPSFTKISKMFLLDIKTQEIPRESSVQFSWTVKEKKRNTHTLKMICWVSKPGKLVEEGPLQEIHNAGFYNFINFIRVRVPSVSCTHIWWVAARRESCSPLAIFDQRSLSRFLYPFPHSQSFSFLWSFKSRLFPWWLF